MWEAGIRFKMTVVEADVTEDDGCTQWGHKVEQALIRAMKEHREEVRRGVITISNLQISKLKFKADM